MVETLADWTQKTDRDPKETSIWICSLCLNQHRMVGVSTSPEELARAFGERVVAIGRILPMLDPWDDPGYVKRAWCLFELYTAIRKNEDCEIDIILSPVQQKAFKDRINKDGSDAKAIDGALSNVRSAEAEVFLLDFS